MRIALIFDGLGVGGIERVGVDYIRLLKSRGYQIDVYNLNPKACEMEKEIDSEITISHYQMSRYSCPYIYTSAKRKWWWGKYIYPFAYIIFDVCQKIKKARYVNSRKYDVAIAFSGHFNDLTFVAEGYLKSSKKACWLHGSIADYVKIADGYEKLYHKIKNLVVLSESKSYKNIEKKLNVVKIYNPTYILERKINISKVEELHKQYGDYLLMVARFTKEKDQKTVIRAMQVLQKRYSIYRNVLFLGDGPEREKTENYVAELGLGDWVHFMGNCLDVQNYYASASILVHSSPAEGLPTVLLEGMAYDLPIVATKSLPGVPEILGEEGKYGLICDIGNCEEMADKLHELIVDEDKYKFYQMKGKERIVSFLPDTIADKIDFFLKNLM